MIATKIDALRIIFGAPLWPRRTDLSETGRELHDAIVRDAKVFALAVVIGDFGSALRISAGWSSAVNHFMDDTRIKGHGPSEKLLSVYLYYCNQVADFSLVRKTA